MVRRLSLGEKQPSDWRQSCAQPSICSRYLAIFCNEIVISYPNGLIIVIKFSSHIKIYLPHLMEKAQHITLRPQLIIKILQRKTISSHNIRKFLLYIIQIGYCIIGYDVLPIREYQYWPRRKRIPILTEAIAEAKIGIQWWISTSYPIPQ